MSRKAQRATIVEVARATGVSTTTVSVVLNDSQSTVRISDSTRAAVKAAAEQIRLPAQPGRTSLRRRRSRCSRSIVSDLREPIFHRCCRQHACERSAARVRAQRRRNIATPQIEVQVLEQLLRNGSSAGVVVSTGRHGARWTGDQGVAGARTQRCTGGAAVRPQPRSGYPGDPHRRRSCRQCADQPPAWPRPPPHRTYSPGAPAFETMDTVRVLKPIASGAICGP